MRSEPTGSPTRGSACPDRRSLFSRSDGRQPRGRLLDALVGQDRDAVGGCLGVGEVEPLWRISVLKQARRFSSKAALFSWRSAAPLQLLSREGSSGRWPSSAQASPATSS